MLDFSNLNSVKDPEAYLKKARLLIGNLELQPSRVEPFRGGYRVAFSLDTLKGVQEVTLKISVDSEIVFYNDSGWFFMPILVPHSSGCSGASRI